MAVFNFLPNRGARFGHQFYELALIRALVSKYSGFLFLENSLEANSRKFGAIFNPSDYGSPNSFTLEIDLSNFKNQEDFCQFLIDEKVDLFRSDLKISGCFQKVSWLGTWVRSELSSIDIETSLESTALYLKSVLVRLGKIPNKRLKRIALHIRRENVSLSLNSARYVPIEYYKTVLSDLFEAGVCLPSNIDIYSTPDFNVSELKEFPGLTYRLELGEVEAFCELASHYFLIGSPSGFSYTAHLVASSAVLIHPLDWNIYYKDSTFRDNLSFSRFVSKFILE